MNLFVDRTALYSESYIPPKLVIFEGVDGSGKSTLFQLYRRATKYGPLAIERFTASNFVYDLYYERESDLGVYLRLERELQKVMPIYLIYLYASPEILARRIRSKETGKDLDIAISNFEGILKCYELYLDRFCEFENVCRVDTGLFNEEQALNLILDFTGGEVNGHYPRS